MKKKILFYSTLTTHELCQSMTDPLPLWGPAPHTIRTRAHLVHVIIALTGKRPDERGNAPGHGGGAGGEDPPGHHVKL